MKKVLWLAIIGVFATSLGLSGCGHMKKDEFLPEYEQFKADNVAAHEEISGSVSNLDKKVDEQKSALDESIAEAKTEAIAASEQGDADTIDTAKNFAKEQDSALKSDLEKEIQDAKGEAKQFSKSEAQKLRKEISKVNKKTNKVVRASSQLKTQLQEGAKVLQETRELAEAPVKVIVYFASGKVSLTAEAKEKLDTAVSMIKDKGPDCVVKVVGHSDTRPVLSGKYRSNWDLSFARAASARDYLVENGITNKIEVVARGHTEPIAAPNAKTGQQENRRVEVIICPPGK